MKGLTKFQRKLCRLAGNCTVTISAWISLIIEGPSHFHIFSIYKYFWTSREVSKIFGFRFCLSWQVVLQSERDFFRGLTLLYFLWCKFYWFRSLQLCLCWGFSSRTGNWTENKKCQDESFGSHGVIYCLHVELEAVFICFLPWKCWKNFWVCSS